MMISSPDPALVTQRGRPACVRARSVQRRQDWTFEMRFDLGEIGDDPPII